MCETKIKIPNRCPVCGDKYRGGSQLPNEFFKLTNYLNELSSGVIYYRCGCSVFLRKYMGVYALIIRPNGCDEEK
jgi:hypothetical protein